MTRDTILEHCTKREAILYKEETALWQQLERVGLTFKAKKEIKKRIDEHFGARLELGHLKGLIQRGGL